MNMVHAEQETSAMKNANQTVKRQPQYRVIVESVDGKGVSYIGLGDTPEAAMNEVKDILRRMAEVSA